MHKHLKFGRARVSNKYCTKGKAPNDDTKTWICQSTSRNIFGNACGKNAMHNFASAPSRNRGRPPKRRDQALALFPCANFSERKWLKAARSYDSWLAVGAAFAKNIMKLGEKQKFPHIFEDRHESNGRRKK